MWLFYAILGAAGKGLTNLFRKQISSIIEADVYLWITLTLSVPFLALVLFMFNIPFVNLITDKPLHVVASSILWIGAIVFNIMAFKREQLSYISPLAAFIPIFSLGLGWLFLGESPPAAGLLGIAMIFAGAYIVNLKSGQVKWYDPLVHLVKNSGARYAMGVAVCFATISIITKDVTNDGFSPIAWIFTSTLSSWLILFYVPIRKTRQVKQAAKNHTKLLLAVFAVTLFGGIFGVYSIASTTYTAYAISVRRFDILFSIILGWKILGETQIRNKIIGGGLMTVGVLIITLL